MLSISHINALNVGDSGHNKLNNRKVVFLCGSWQQALLIYNLVSPGYKAGVGVVFA